MLVDCFRAASATAMLVLVLFPSAAMAGAHLSPGLWEQRITMKSDDPGLDQARMRMHEQLAAMPPERREVAARMMVDRRPGMRPTPSTSRLCLTKEEAERDSPPLHDGRCMQESSRTGDTLTVRFSCPGRDGGTPVSGQSVFTMNGSTAYTGHSVVTMALQGKPTRVGSEVNGKWLGSDCGEVAPQRSPAP